jgi:3-mercaptopyruvate sulfurtransferase SseA
LEASLPNNQKRPLFPILLIIAGVILLIGAVAIVLLNFPEERSAPSEVIAQDSFPQVERVNPAQAKEAYDADAAVFVDVRDPAYFQTSHIPGALSIPLSEIEARYIELDPSDWIILYCT